MALYGVIWRGLTHSLTHVRRHTSRFEGYKSCHIKNFKRRGRVAQSHSYLRKCSFFFLEPGWSGTSWNLETLKTIKNVLQIVISASLAWCYMGAASLVQWNINIPSTKITIVSALPLTWDDFGSWLAIQVILCPLCNVLKWLPCEVKTCVIRRSGSWMEFFERKD